MITITKASILFLLSILSSAAYCQNFERVNFDYADSSNYYLAVKPQSDIKGVLVLLPGFGEIPENIFPETKLHNVGYANGIMTVTLGVGPKLYVDKSVINKINGVLKDVVKRFRVSPNNFVLGGFSAGGTISLRYTEMTVEKPADFPVKLKGVFAIDSPVDLVDIYNYFQRELVKNFSDAGVNEAKLISKIMTQEIGTPKTNLDTYRRLTPFYSRNDGPGNERYLKDLPVRVYHDIDVFWQLENRRRSLYDCNCLNSSAMINQLIFLGNKEAEFVQSKRPGVRSSGFRHTHSWSIVEEVETIQWVKKIIENKD